MLADAIRDIQVAAVARQGAQRERARLARPMQELDVLLTELEDLHLAGRQRVPAAWGPRLEALGALIPDGCRRVVPPRTTIGRLMDALYEMQDCLLDRRDARRPSLRACDAAADGTSVDASTSL
jgi:hypothetical protein